MKISAFSMCQNAVKLYYPILESILSVLPIVDEYVIAVGAGDFDDDTLAQIRSLNSEKVRILETDWDLVKFQHGTIHAQQTDFAKAHCTGDWLIYLQADEVLHEEDHELIKTLAAQYLDDPRVEGFLFQYLHFWGDYNHIAQAHGWYGEEIRMVRNMPDIHSWESAQSFRVIEVFDGVSYRKKQGSRKLRVIESSVRVFHYGWVRPTDLMKTKMNRLDQIHSHPYPRYHGQFDYGDEKRCLVYSGSHPAVMNERMLRIDWQPWKTNISKGTRPPHKHERLKNRLMTWLEQKLFGGRAIFAFRNYDKLPQ